LTLPDGALVALRRSGGLVFRSREIVVYGDGRVETSSMGGGRAARQGAGRRLDSTEVAELRQALERVKLDQVPAPIGQQSPDMFVYEIAVSEGGVPRMFEIADGSIPDTVAPLIRRLNALATTE
jgi:hypothetical protein